jgi:hypothetical protein
MVGLSRILILSTLAMASALFLTGEGKALDYDYTGMVTPVTPFDSLYRPIEKYLESGNPYNHPKLGESLGPGFIRPIKALRKYLKAASRFAYIPDGNGGDDTTYRLPSNSRKKKRSFEHWQLPEETEERGAGDCEDKAIWLYSRLLQAGFENVRLVVGKYRIDQPDYHAWVVSYLSGKIYILDPTMDEGIWQARQYPKGFYKPVFSYSRTDRWYHFRRDHQLLMTTLATGSD